MSTEQEIKNAIRLAGTKAQTQYLEAQQAVKMPNDPHSVLDDWEAGVAEWQDHPNLPQKAKVLTLIKQARRALHNSNEGDFKLYLYLILVNQDFYQSDIWTIKKEEADAKNFINSKKPRPNAISPMKAKIIALMHSYKIDGTEFETFMQAWRRETLDGLRLTCLNPEAKSDAQKFSVDNENEEKKKNHELTRNTLQRNYWTKAL